MRHVIASIAALALGSMFAGCTAMRSVYERPAAELPPSYVHADATAKASVDRWWTAYGDPRLDALIEEALRRNDDLAVAVLKVKAASLAVHLAVINPQVSASYAYSESRFLKGDFPVERARSLLGSVSYELDLWGELRAERDAARWEARATDEDRQSAVLTLIGGTVSIYFRIGDLNERIGLTRENLDAATKTLELTQTLRVAGGDSKLEVEQARQTLETQEATLSALIEQRVEARNALAVLLDGRMWPATSELQSLPVDPPPPVASGLPASLLQRRPDLRAADLRLRESLATMDATRLSFYPQLTLTGSLGATSTGLTQLLDNPLESVTAGLAAPFLQIDEAHFATALARTQYEEAAVSFRKTLVQALYEVDNALSTRTQLTEQGERLKKSWQAAREVERLTEVRYRTGASTLQAWLDAQQARRQAQIPLLENRLARLQNYATLCQTLGGAGDSGLPQEAVQASTSH